MRVSTRSLRRIGSPNLWLMVPVAAAVLFLAAYLGQRASSRWLGLLVAGIGGVVLLRRPVLGLLALVVVALALPLQFSTGTQVMLNPAALLVPALLVLWLLDMVRRRDLRLAPSRTTPPLLLFLLAGLLALLVGNAFWDSFVPRPGNFIIVQLSQWAIFAFSATAFWLAGNLIHEEVWLQRLAVTFFILGGSLAILRVLPGAGTMAQRISTIALNRAPFWLLLVALAGGQLLFNRQLSAGWRLFLLAVLAAVLFYSFVLLRISASTWVGVGAVVGALVWLRFPRLRWLAATLFLVLAGIGVLFPTVYNFAGGDYEWFRTGGSRLALIERVVDVTMHNPITGLGPAAYRPYTSIEPLVYAHIVWVFPRVSSHNNYVDLFAHTGLLGLAFFLWFVAEVTRLGWRLRSRFTEGFAAGYVNGMLAAGAGALTVMLLADWILPFVYNIGFPGFQASVLVWLFLGGLISLDAMMCREMLTEADHAT